MKGLFSCKLLLEHRRDGELSSSGAKAWVKVSTVIASFVLTHSLSPLPKHVYWLTAATGLQVGEMITVLAPAQVDSY